MKETIAEYFAFTKKERKGIIVLLTLIILLIIAPYYLNYIAVNKLHTIDPKLQQQLAQLQLQKDTATNRYNNKYASNYDDQNNGSYRDYTPHWKAFEKNYDQENLDASLFAFNPNTLTAEGWKNLGLKDKTITTLQNYISKGGRFRTADDIKKIWGISPALQQRLLPYIQIDDVDMPQSNTTASYSNNYPPNTTTTTYTKKDANYKIDINTADTLTWQKLPGIGSKLAWRIVQYRNKLGGFNATQQIAETFGLQDSTFEKIKTNLVCNPNEELTKININTATINDLRHPYLPNPVANNLLQYRNQHGKFATIADLKRLALMTDNIFEKLAPYISID